jgi:Ca2+:H+ antiporter
MKYLRLLLIFIPISIICEMIKLNSTIIFIVSALSIIPLAGIMGEATGEISQYAGGKIGGFLNATFGNATELIISFFAIKSGLFDVVKASLIGSVIGNVLLVLGASMFFGGLKYKTQKFNKNVIEVTSSMLLFAAIGLSIPAIFTYTTKNNSIINPDKISTPQIFDLSLAVAIVMFIIYFLSLFFSFYTHKDIYAVEETESHEAKWSLKLSMFVLLTATIAIAFESEFLVSSVEPMTRAFGLSKFFVGIILIPIIGNAAEHSTAVIMSLKNKMDVAIEIALGSSLQIILFVTPLIIFISFFFTKHMNIIFNEFELITLIVSVFIANKVSTDGQSNWLEGVQLLAVYIIIAISFTTISI